jgi:hypothetical protein
MTLRPYQTAALDQARQHIPGGPEACLDRRAHGAWQITMKMPFGRYKGRLVSSLPDDYLEWLAALDNLREPLAAAVWRELNRREPGEQREWTPPPPPQSPSTVALRIAADEVPLAKQIFDAGYRSVARVTHPDTGGDLDQMKRLNALAQSVRNQLASLEGR